MASSNGFGNVPTSLKFEHNPFEQSFASKSQTGEQKLAPPQPAKQRPSGENVPHPGESHTLPGIQQLTSPGPLATNPSASGWQAPLRMNNMLGQPQDTFGVGQAMPSPPVLLANPGQARAPSVNSPAPTPSVSATNPGLNRSSENLAASSLYMMSNGSGLQTVPPPPLNRNLPPPQGSSAVPQLSQTDSDTTNDSAPSRKRSVEAVDDSANLSPDEKRRQFLERNRIAAVKCRQRKKQYMDDLKGKTNYLMTVNDELNMELMSLRSQLDTLKGYIVSHNDIRSLPGPVLSIIESLQRPGHQAYGPMGIMPGGPGTMSTPTTAVPSPAIDHAQRGLNKVGEVPPLPANPRVLPGGGIENPGMVSR